MRTVRPSFMTLPLLFRDSHRALELAGGLDGRRELRTAVERAAPLPVSTSLKVWATS